MIEKSNLRNSLFGLETPCPKGTVPVRRNTKNDLIQAKSLLNNDILASAPTPTPQDLGKGDHVSFQIFILLLKLNCTHAMIRF